LAREVASKTAPLKALRSLPPQFLRRFIVLPVHRLRNSPSNRIMRCRRIAGKLPKRQSTGGCLTQFYGGRAMIAAQYQYFAKP
jgi:hypothetical protein